MRTSTLLALAFFVSTGCAHFSFVPQHVDRTFSRTVDGTFTHLELQSASGNVHIRGVAGAQVQVSGRVSAWAMNGTQAAALADATAANPPIEACKGVLRIGARRDLLPRAQGYAIDYEVVVPPELAASIDSASGEVEVHGLSGEVRIDSASGDVTVSRVGAARVHSASGNVRLSEIVGELSVDTASGDVRITGAPAPSSRWRVDVSSGDVSLVVPEGAAFHLDAETSSGRVMSELPLTVRGVLDPAALHADVGDAPTAQVTIDTSSGDVHLRR